MAMPLVAALVVTSMATRPVIATWRLFGVR
jgi:hypothetical protein